MDRLEVFNSEIVKLCKIYKVKKLYAFGSVLTDKYTSESDIDLIVDFYDIPLEDYADNYFDFKFSLQAVFGRPVDLLEEQAIKNPILIRSINKSKKILFMDERI